MRASRAPGPARMRAPAPARASRRDSTTSPRRVPRWEPAPAGVLALTARAAPSRTGRLQPAEPPAAGTWRAEPRARARQVAPVRSAVSQEEPPAGAPSTDRRMGESRSPSVAGSSCTCPSSAVADRRKRALAPACPRVVGAPALALPARTWPTASRARPRAAPARSAPPSGGRAPSANRPSRAGRLERDRRPGPWLHWPSSAWSRPNPEAARPARVRPPGRLRTRSRSPCRRSGRPPADRPGSALHARQPQDARPGAPRRWQ